MNDELFNKSNKKLKKKKIKWNRYLIRKPMTLIIGSRCKDGVILAGDRRVLRGTEYSEEKKIIEAFQDFIVGASGISGLMDKFLAGMRRYLESKVDGEELKWKGFECILEDIVYSLFQRYEGRLVEGQNTEIGALYFDVLYGVKEYLDHASLYHMYNNGFSVEVKRFDIIGHGQPHALPFLKKLYYPEITMDKMIKLCVFVLKLIDESNIDLSVGGKPQIWKIPDKGHAFELPDDEINNLLSQSATDKLKDIIFF